MKTGKINLQKRQSVNIRKQRIKRADRFRRIKNRSEKVYAAPAFYKADTGILTITESGIIQRSRERNIFIKTYEIRGTAVWKADESGFKSEFYQKLCRRCAYLQIIFSGRGTGGHFQSHLLLGVSAFDLEQAQTRFAELENESSKGIGGINFLSVDGNRKIEKYCNFLSEACDSPYSASDYFREVYAWKDISAMRGIEETEDKYIKTKQGCHSVIMIQKYPYVLEENCLQEILNQKFVQAAVLDVESISNTVIRELFKNCYIGMEGIVSRMKRVNPQLYSVLAEEDGKEEEMKAEGENVGTDAKTDDLNSFMNSSVSFLVRSQNPEQMEKNMEVLNNIAKEHHMRLRQLCFAKPDILRAFGMTGERMDYAGQIQPLSDMENIIPYLRKTGKNAEAYDVDELKKLFLE